MSNQPAVQGTQNWKELYAEKSAQADVMIAHINGTNARMQKLQQLWRTFMINSTPPPVVEKPEPLKVGDEDSKHAAAMKAWDEYSEKMVPVEVAKREAWAEAAKLLGVELGIMSVQLNAPPPNPPAGK